MRRAPGGRGSGPALLHVQPGAGADRDPRRSARPAAPGVLTRLIVVSGAPGTGKTSLATDIGRALGIPVIHRDTVKEALFDTIGAEDPEESHKLGRASYAVLYAVARVILEAGSSLIVESNFVRGTSEQELSPLMREGEAVLIHCQTTRDLIARRVRSRAGRHPQHPDDVDEVLQAVDAHRHDPLELRFPLLIVDTSEGYRPGLDEVLRFCRGDI